jgi:DNA-binding CsgD family transcriptional regulator
MTTAQALYEAAFDDEAHGALAGLVAEAVGSRAAIVHWMADDGGQQIFSHHNFALELMSGWAERLEEDPWTVAGKRLPLGEATRLSRYVPPAVYGASTFYNDWVVPAGDDTFWCMGMVLRCNDGLGVVSLHRGAREEDFGADQAARLQALEPHLRRVLQVRSRMSLLERRALLMGETLDRWSAAVIHLGPGGRLVMANDAGVALLARGDALALREGRVTALHNGAAARLATALARALAVGVGDAFRMARAGEAEPYAVNLLPLPAAAGGRETAVLIVSDPAATPASAAGRWAALYDFTDAESAVAEGLMAGLTLEVIAEQRGVRISTVRSLLKRAAQKAGVSRQGELIAKLARLPGLTA